MCKRNESKTRSRATVHGGARSSSANHLGIPARIALRQWARTLPGGFRSATRNGVRAAAAPWTEQPGPELQPARPSPREAMRRPPRCRAFEHRARADRGGLSPAWRNNTIPAGNGALGMTPGRGPPVRSRSAHEYPAANRSPFRPSSNKSLAAASAPRQPVEQELKVRARPYT